MGRVWELAWREVEEEFETPSSEQSLSGYLQCYFYLFWARRQA